MADRKTAVEVYADGHREVYHHHVPSLGDTGPGFAWTHLDAKKEREDCSMCQSDTLASVRGAPA
jgi:hypothetical protein